MAATEQNGAHAGEASEPRGFGERTRGLAGEYAHEQGWGLDVEERTKMPEGKQDISGGTDYDYSARDFGDEPVNMERVAATTEKDESAARKALEMNEQSSTTEER